MEVFIVWVCSDSSRTCKTKKEHPNTDSDLETDIEMEDESPKNKEDEVSANKPP